jgi:hypothetical protein
MIKGVHNLLALLFSALTVGACQKSTPAPPSQSTQSASPSAPTESTVAAPEAPSKPCDAHAFYLGHLKQVETRVVDTGNKVLGPKGFTVVAAYDALSLDSRATCDEFDRSNLLGYRASIDLNLVPSTTSGGIIKKLNKSEFNGVSLILNYSRDAESTFTSFVHANPVKAISAYTGGVLTPRDLEDLAPLVNLADPLKIGQRQAYRYDKVANQIIAQKSYASPVAHATGLLTMQGLELKVTAQDRAAFDRFDYYWFLSTVAYDSLDSSAQATFESVFSRLSSALDKLASASK